MNLSLRPIQKNPAPLAVRPDTAGELAPAYVTQIEFSKKQAVQTFWSIRYSSEGKWLSNWLKFSNQQDFSCEATLNQKGEKWKIALASYGKM